MTSLKEIQSPVKEHIIAFEDTFRASMKSSVPLLDTITRYIIKRKGEADAAAVCLPFCKRSRWNQRKYLQGSCFDRIAAYGETLVHDDVVDDSNMRRGFFSLNALWKNKIAVLVGDYLLSTGIMTFPEK